MYTHTMEKRIKPSDKPMASKVIYGAVIAILCLTAIIVGIVSAAKKAEEPPITENPGVEDGTGNEKPGNTEDGENNAQKPGSEEKKLCFVAPIAGTVVKAHDLETPVFSQTLGEWKVHTGIDISCEDGAEVFASEAGTVSKLFNDPLMGYTVEITHADDFVTRYSNLKADSGIELKVGDTIKSGDRIGVVGDSSVSELAEESHLHFEMLLKDVKVNPMDYLSEESKKTSLGIE